MPKERNEEDSPLETTAKEEDEGEDDGEERKIRDGIPSVYRCISVTVERPWTFLLM